MPGCGLDAAFLSSNCRLRWRIVRIGHDPESYTLESLNDVRLEHHVPEGAI